MTAVLERPATAPARPRRNWTAVALLAPAMTLIALFVVLPGVLAFAGALFTIDLTDNSWEWAGLDNLATVLVDPAVQHSLVNTLVYSVLTIVPSLVAGVGLALLAQTFTRGRSLLQTLLFLPFTANLVAMAVVFRYVFDLRGGFVNQLLAVVGIAPVNFLGDTALALPTVAAIGVWRAAALAMVMFLAGLTAIPTAVHEACAADGVTGWTKLRRVTLPLLRPVTVFVTVLTILQSVQVFDTIDVLTGGGPQGATETVLTMTWKLGFEYYDLGQGAALSALLLVVLVGIGILRRGALTR
ncbi:carbohydrate ABC transporter permease [Pseudonocardia pini]|uniref:carbohydrate ABC transporter permease n=1 Tax=Pseudonocardia pini TaxID=2758030 RepID=UPI0015F0A801|nr:sugar ABC transporter permease [Pseudonocardia pini]